MSHSADKESINKDLSHLFLDMTQMETFRRHPTIIREAHGLVVTDIDGKEYLDGLSGIWVVNIGHGNQAVIAAMIDQLHRFTFSMPIGTINEPAIRLARLLAEITPPELTTVKFVNSGSEATETALKLARQYFLQTGFPRKTKIISRYLSWHGATMGALSMSGTPGLKAPFEPLLGGCLHVPPPYCYRCPYGLTYPDCDVACARIIEKVIEWEGPDTVAAVIIDPVMVSAGILVPPDEYLKTVRQICDRTNTLLIFDEVITGFGRTGKMFAMDTFGVVPDIVAMAKGISSGYAPLAGIIASQKVAQAFLGADEEHVEFMHGITFGANPLSATAGLANITQMLQGDMLANAQRVAAYLQSQAQGLYKHAIVGDVRGVGLMMGVEFVADRQTRAPFPAIIQPGIKIQQAAKRRGLLMRANPHWVALGPPLITTEADIDQMLSILDASIDEVAAEIMRG
ncbi:MAG: aspartate aminotransferase family protein [Chloroflexi bacterium]|nr:aspartate aminotransferase family protein [Chloroflexota bacterium]